MKLVPDGIKKGTFIWYTEYNDDFYRVTKIGSITNIVTDAFIAKSDVDRTVSYMSFEDMLGSIDNKKCLSIGASGEYVKNLQCCLNRYFESLSNEQYMIPYSTLMITGYYGGKTKDCVACFQRINNLDDDGIAGPKTLQLLYDWICFDNDSRG